MNIILQTLPYLALAAIGLWTLFRTTNALIAAEAERVTREQQRCNARRLKRAWKAKIEAPVVVARNDHYRVHACVYGSRRGVEL